MFTFGSAPKRHGNEEVQQEEDAKKDDGQVRYEVVHKELAVRSSADTQASIAGTLKLGQFVTGLPATVDGSPWLQLSGEAIASLGLDEQYFWLEKGVASVKSDASLYGNPKVGDRFTKAHLATARSKLDCTAGWLASEGFIVEKAPQGWVLIDGKKLGLGLLLKEAPLPGTTAITKDIVRWATDHQAQSMTAEREAALRDLDKAARKQVEALRPALQTPAAVTELQRSGLLTAAEAARGEEAMAGCILRILLMKRLGEKVEGAGLQFADWEVERFEAYTQERVLPLTPFRCRTFTPGRVQRVLVLLHGMLVAGDDLASEAEVLRRLMPETAVVLPEAPVLLDEEHGLRAWWPPPKEPGELQELQRRGELTAPEVTVRRLVATVYWVLRHVGGVPLVLGGFSQGSQLLAQSLAALRRAEVAPLGLVILSGLVASFEVPPGVQCLAIHGGKDEKVPLKVAQTVAREMQLAKAKLAFEEVPQLGHQISDEELERVAKFCDEVAPIEKQGRALTAEEQEQEAQKAKLMRYVKRMSEGLQMYDKDWFMVHICDLKMQGLGKDSPALGGDALRYHLHDAGPESRGLVVLFHGMVSNLRKETDPLALAYVRALKVSVCVVDYRQRTSFLNIDAQMVLESLEELSGSGSKPVVLHGAGFGATCAIHMAMASQVMPPEVGRRLRLLVLDGAMGAIHMNVGCTTKDPIGNDSKLAYVRLPLCVLGGDDKLCGLTVGDTQWNQVSQIAEDLHQTKKISKLTLIPEPALKVEGGERSLHPQLFQAVSTALDALTGTAAGDTDFIVDVLDVSEEFAHEKPEDNVLPWTPKTGTSPKDQLLAICKKATEAAVGRLKDTIKEAKEQPEPQRSDGLIKAMLSAIGPQIGAHGGFLAGVEGLRQFEAALGSVSEFFPELQKVRSQLCQTFDLGLLRGMDAQRLARLSKECAGQDEAAAETTVGGAQVVVKHMTKGGTVTISVPESSTILDVRQAIMAKLKETNLNKVKLVMAAAKGTKMIPDAEPLGGRTELLMVGRTLD